MKTWNQGRPQAPGESVRLPDGATTPGRSAFAEDLRVGDELLLRDRRIEPVDHLRLYTRLDNVYNFEVNDLSCYAINQCGVLVHNTSEPEGRLENVAPNKALERNINPMSRATQSPRSDAEAALRREAEVQQRILGDRLTELGIGEGGGAGKGATRLPPEAANEPIAQGL